MKDPPSAYGQNSTNRRSNNNIGGEPETPDKQLAVAMTAAATAAKRSPQKRHGKALAEGDINGRVLPTAAAERTSES